MKVRIMSKALLPGSYDPITVGHLDIIRRCSKMFDEVVVLISKNSSKNYMLCSKNRAALAEDAVKDLPNVRVDVFDGYLVDYAKANNIDVTVKGLRNGADFEYEQNMAYTNLQLSRNIHGYDFETLYMPCNKKFSDISSSLVRMLLQKNGSIDELVPNSKLLLELIKA
jgi:pantetheine-phosphate adenylyltransferase